MKTKTFNNLLELLEVIDGIESMANTVKHMKGKCGEAENLCQSAAQNILADVKKARKQILRLV